MDSWYFSDNSHANLKPDNLDILQAGVSDLAPNWARLVPNRENLGLFNISFLFILAHQANLGLFKISFCSFWRGAPK